MIVNSTKSTSKIPKLTTPAQKRPSTDESNESNKKLKLDDEKSKASSIEEQTPTITAETQPEVSTSNKPSIVITSPTHESSANPPKADEPSAETNPQTTPTKFGIVFTSHHRHSTSTPPSASVRAQSTETSTSHETSKNEEEEMEGDHDALVQNKNTIQKNDQTPSTTNTLKPPTATQTPLSDDETLNPETMQLSDLIGATRREGPKAMSSRSTAKTAGKGKRTAKQDTSSNKRQQTKTQPKTVQSTVSTEKELEPPTDATVLPSTEPTSSAVTNAKRLSSTESASISSPVHEKDVMHLLLQKRLVL